jgi:hypothetical protein
MPLRLFIRHLCFGAGLSVLVLVRAVASGAQGAADEFTREVARYELSLTRLEAYGATLSALAEWALARPVEAAALRQREPKGPATFPQSVAHVASEPVIATLLQKNKLTARDFVLIPVVVMQAQMAALGEAQGRTFPADRINPKNTAVVRDHEKRVAAILAKVATDRARLAGR